MTATSPALELPRNTAQIGSGLLVVAAGLLPLIPQHEGIVCPLRLTTGIPCPLCGMTTSLTAAGRGQIAEAVMANPAGLVALVTAIVILVARPRRLRIPASALVAGLSLMWLFQLFRFDVL